MAAGTPVREAAMTRHETRPAPLLGQDTDDILASVLGLTSREIGELHDPGIVAGPERDPTAVFQSRP